MTTTTSGPRKFKRPSTARAPRVRAPSARSAETSVVEAVRKADLVDHLGQTIRGPTAVRAEWLDPDDVNPNRRESLVVRGWRAADPLREIHARSGVITQQHIAAADKLRGHYEVGFLGAQPGRGGIAHEPAGGGSSGDNFASWAQLQRMQDVREAFAAVGRQAEAVLRAIVLAPPDPDAPRSVRALAAELRINQSVALGLLIAALDRLVEHYEPKVERV